MQHKACKISYVDPGRQHAMNMLAEDTSAELRHISPVLAIKFSIDDLPLVAHFLNLKTIQSCEQHNGSNDLYLFEQIAFLDSLTSVEPPALKRRRIRHQHFWRDKLAVDERVYVKSADVQLAMEAAVGAKELLNRKISPLGVRLFHAMQSQLELQQQDMQLQLAERGPAVGT